MSVITGGTAQRWSCAEDLPAPSGSPAWRVSPGMSSFESPLVDRYVRSHSKVAGEWVVLQTYQPLSGAATMCVCFWLGSHYGVDWCTSCHHEPDLDGAAPETGLWDYLDGVRILRSDAIDDDRGRAVRVGGEGGLTVVVDADRRTAGWNGHGDSNPHEVVVEPCVALARA